MMHHSSKFIIYLMNNDTVYRKFISFSAKAIKPHHFISFKGITVVKTTHLDLLVLPRISLKG